MDLRKEHGKNFPTVRIANIVIDNFKGVKHGEITMNCGKKYVPYGTQSDITGIYGQNGSGKSTVIESLQILKLLMTGDTLPYTWADYFNDETPASFEYTFDFQYPDNGTGYPSNRDIRKVVYSVKIKKVDANIDADLEKELQEYYDDFYGNSSFGKTIRPFIPEYKRELVVFDEVLKVSGTIRGQRVPLKPFFDTTDKDSIVLPQTKAKILLGEIDSKLHDELIINRSRAEDRNQSFIFMNEMRRIYNKVEEYSDYHQMIVELFWFAKYYLHVIDATIVGEVGTRFVLPFFLPHGKIINISATGKMWLPQQEYEEVAALIEKESDVVEKLVPGISLGVKTYGAALNEDGEEGTSFELITYKNGVEIPLRCESNGIIKIISTLQCLIAVYNQRSTTVAYDEFDAGIFEYLLGELLKIIQTSGKGQFVFTSHNMRPLEVLKKEFVWFTTNNPENRYTKLTGIGETNNLRKVYYREIAFGEHFDNLYTETEKDEIKAALRKAGGM